MLYKEVEERRRKLIEFIRKNPQTTHKEIKKKLHLKVEKIYPKGMGEAFKEAGVRAPRTFKIKTKEEKIDILLSYIRKNPRSRGHTIKKHTKINFQTIFKNTEELFKVAGVEYSRKMDNRTREQKKKEIINLIKAKPLVTIEEMMSLTSTNFYNFFDNIEEAYNLAGVKPTKGHLKRRIKKIKEVTDFIKQNPTATQREINLRCKTHIQLLFKEGIFQAYREAGVRYPYERITLYGSAIKSIKTRAKEFEDRIAMKLSGYGLVNRLVKTNRGFADIIFERNGKLAIIEIKDYLAKEVSQTDIKQLNKYLEDRSCEIGILICHKKPKKDRFLIGENRIFLVEEGELSKIPLILDKGLYFNG